MSDTQTTVENKEKPGAETLSASLFFREFFGSLKYLALVFIFYLVGGFFVFMHPHLVTWISMGADLNKMILVTYVPAGLCLLTFITSVRCLERTKKSENSRIFILMLTGVFLLVFGYLYSAEWVAISPSVDYERLSGLQQYGLLGSVCLSFLAYLANGVVLFEFFLENN